MFVMKIALQSLNRFFLVVGIFTAFFMGSFFTMAGTDPSQPIDKGFLKTNGQYVTIGTILVETNSPLNSDEFKLFKWRDELLSKILRSGLTNSTELMVEGSWKLIKDFPDHAENGYQNIMIAIEDYELDGRTAKLRSLVDELIASSAPEQYKLWAKGFLHRLDSRSQSISMQFIAADGREVDLAKMRGNVVLVDFWSTHCVPCVAELPRVKAAFEKFHSQGFEVVGVSCDTDKSDLEKFVKEHAVSWPQYFDGKRQHDNKFTVDFGIDGIPHMFLVDKNGVLRFDHVRANDKFRRKGDATSMEEKIAALLAEPNN
jgi:peroxiredoxin